MEVSYSGGRIHLTMQESEFAQMCLEDSDANFYIGIVKLPSGKKFLRIVAPEEMTHVIMPDDSDRDSVLINVVPGDVYNAGDVAALADLGLRP